MVDISQAFTLTGKVAIVTGAGAGIGEAAAQVFAAAGAAVVVVDWNGDAATGVADRIVADGGRATAKKVDVSDQAAVDALVAETVAEFGKLDILVNNAGIMVRRPALEISAEEFDRILSVNLKGVLYGSQAAGRVLTEGGSIINVLSEIIDRGTAGTGSYAAAKKGAEALTRTFAVELGAKGIRVNGIAPAWTVSAMTMQRGLDASGEFHQDQFDEVKKKLEGISLIGTVNEPVDIAYGMLFLASQAGRNISGQVLRINGGSSMV